MTDRHESSSQVFETPGKGYGLQCRTALTEGELVMEYCGEVLSATEFARRSYQYDEAGDSHW